VQVHAAPVAFRPAAGYQAGLLQDPQVVGEQVRRHRQDGGQLRGGGIPVGQQVGDAQPRRVGQGSVHPRTLDQISA